MTASEIITKLRILMNEHGDLPVTFGTEIHEYSVSFVGYSEEEGLSVMADNPPERFVLEGKVNLDPLDPN